MTTPQKAKGSQWERDCVAALQRAGFKYAERRYGAGANIDKGDITGLPGLVIECKNHKALAIAEWIAEAELERANAKSDYGVVFVKRRGKSAEEGYAIMTIGQFARLWQERNDL